MATKVNQNTDSEVAVEDKIEVPRRYKVIFHNDNFTPFEFVIAVLSYVFNTDFETAGKIAVKVHTEGKAVVGVYPKAVAQEKAKKVQAYAEQSEVPLKCTIEAE